MRSSEDKLAAGSLESYPDDHSRREFLLRAGGAVAGAAFIGVTSQSFAAPERRKVKFVGPLSNAERKSRRKKVYALKKRLALQEYKSPVVPLSLNGDEAVYPNGIACFSKSLPHDENGIADPAALQAFLQACQAGTAKAFEDVPAGGGLLQFKNPMAGYGYTLTGTDPHNTYLPPPPTLASAEQASEAAEVYWQALLRDVPFSQYARSPLVQAACDDLNRFSDFRGPREGAAVTPQTLFRSTIRGASAGPYLSQFLLKEMTMGHTPMSQMYLCAEPGSDYVHTWEEWLALQRGIVPSLDVPLQPAKRFLTTGRDVAHHVHLDFPYQTTMTAALVMANIGVPVNASNPYLAMPRQCAFATFGQADVMAAIAQVSTLALKTAWRHKWTLHRRTRPEEFCGRVHRRLTAGLDFPVNTELLGSRVLEETFSRTGSYLLPQAFPEGSPAHPSYPSGHATFLGACVTVLKAYYNETHVIPDPVVPSDDGQLLLPHQGPPLTVGSELNKLASNVAFGRNFSGVHWRTDATEGILLGEQVAISMLRDFKATYSEQFQFRFSSFNGTVIII